MFTAFSRAFGQLGDPRVRRVLWISLAATVLVYAILVAGLSWLMFDTQVLSDLPLWDSVLDWTSVIIVPIVALFLFPAIITAVLGFFLEEVAAAVEDKWYPRLEAPREVGLGETLWSALRFAAIAILLNLVLLPFLLIPVIGQVAYYAINGYLLGREYFELVMLRRMNATEVFTLRKRHTVRIWTTGAVTAFLLTIPFVNIIAAVLGTAAMVHVAQKVAANRPATLP